MVESPWKRDYSWANHRVPARKCSHQGALPLIPAVLTTSERNNNSDWVLPLKDPVSNMNGYLKESLSKSLPDVVLVVVRFQSWVVLYSIIVLLRKLLDRPTRALVLLGGVVGLVFWRRVVLWFHVEINVRHLYVLSVFVKLEFLRFIANWNYVFRGDVLIYRC